MNIDKSLVARAMDKAGEEPITEQEWTEGTGTRVRLIKDVYLSTILEALAGTDWTSQKKRAKLVLSEDENLTDYQYAYVLPIDCAKPSALRDEGVYLVEGNKLYTNTPDAVLIYISNNYNGELKYEFNVADPQPASQDEVAAGNYYKQVEEEYVQVTEYLENLVYFERTVVIEDYDGYDDFNFDPLLSEYIETTLAQKIVLKLTGDINKYQLLYGEARIMENKAIKASVAHGHNKDKGNPYWGDTLGLPNYGGN